MYTKLFIYSTFQIFMISFLVSYFDVKIPIPDLATLQSYIPYFGQKDEGAQPRTDAAQAKKKGSKTNGKKPKEQTTVRVLTTKELARYDGEKGSKGLYLGVLGKVYNVEKGKKHYGPGGGYHFFAGKDATRAFVTGEFNEAGLIDDVTDLSHQDFLGIEEWLSFYEKSYEFVGHLQGTYYDSKGRPTPAHEKVQENMAAAHKWQASQAEETKKFPPCNSEWSQGKGGRVWCSNKSGGINREWAGVPRKLFKPGSSQSRCACVKNFGASSDGEKSASNRGDLDNPNLHEYDNCNPSAISCKLPDSK